MRAAVSTFAKLPSDGRRIAILGGMAELGECSIEEHEKLGREASSSGIDLLVSVGSLARGITASLNGSCPIEKAHFETHEECVAFLKDQAIPGDSVLVKGSRSAAMEKILKGFEEEAPQSSS